MESIRVLSQDDVHLGVFAHVCNSRNRDTKVTRRAPEICTQASAQTAFHFFLALFLVLLLSNMASVAVYFYCYYYTTCKAVAAAFGERNG